MAVLCEAISVVARRDAIGARFRGGWDAYQSSIPNATHCADDHLSRVGFMIPDDVGQWSDHLIAHGLRMLDHDAFVDFAIVDQLSGPTRRAPWLVFAQMFAGYSMAWIRGEEPRKLSVPEGWTVEQSQSLARGFRTPQEFAGLRYSGRRDEIDVYVDPQTGQELFLGRPSIDDPRKA